MERVLVPVTSMTANINQPEHRHCGIDTGLSHSAGDILRKNRDRSATMRVSMMQPQLELLKNSMQLDRPAKPMKIFRNGRGTP